MGGEKEIERKKDKTINKTNTLSFPTVFSHMFLIGQFDENMFNLLSS